MQTDNPAFRAYLQQRHVRLARLFTITRSDGAVFRFTDHDANLTYGGNTFSSRTGFTASSVMMASGSQANGLTITTFMRGDGLPTSFDPGDFRAGNFDGALALVDLCAWDNPGLGTINLFTGEVGETRVTDRGGVEIDIDEANSGRKIRLERYSASCRAKFGDERCKVPLDPLKKTFTVATTSGDRQSFTTAETTDTDPLKVDYWQYGTLVFDTGLNTGVATKVMQSGIDGSLVLYLPVPFDIAVGDTGRIWPGCDYQFTSGCVRWDNRLNFRGEPGFQKLQPPPQPVVPDDGGDDGGGGDGSGTWQPYYVLRPDLPGHAFFWGVQQYHWSGTDAPPSGPPADSAGFCNSVGGGGFPACQGPQSLDGGDPYSSGDPLPGSAT